MFSHLCQGRTGVGLGSGLIAEIEIRNRNAVEIRIIAD